MDVFRQVLTANGYTYEAKGSYVQAVIKPDGTKVAEFSKIGRASCRERV